MDPAQRLENLEEWVVWVRDELGREVGDLVAAVAAPAVGLNMFSTTSAAIVGRHQINERVEPLLNVLDQIAEQLHFVREENDGAD
jgi:hypothetical protein